MKKAILIITMTLLILASYAMAVPLDLCEDTREIQKDCMMLTPAINCTAYNYSIYNTTGDLMENKTLTLLSADIYYFNMTEDKGDYIVRLCDGTTREIRVKEEEDKMILAALMMLPMLLAIAFMIAAASLGDDHRVFRIFLFLMSPILFLLSLHLGLTSVAKYYDFPELEGLIGTSVYWFSWVFAVILIYFLMYAFYKVIRNAAQDKDDELNY